MRFRFFFVLAAVWVAAACTNLAEDARESAGELTSETKKFDVNRLLEDEDLIGGSDITTTQVQTFLESKSSFLATYTEDSTPAAQIIVERAQEKGISPVYMLARIQGESGLVESKKPTAKSIERATGCGCPDNKACAEEFKGFTNQIKCAADLLKKYFDQMEKNGKTVSGWAVDKEMKTLDPCTVKPANRATVALYTYTPWVGAYAQGCGTEKWAGSSGMALFTAKYREAFPGGSPRTRPDPKPTPGKNCDPSKGKVDSTCSSPAPSPAGSSPVLPTCVPLSESELCDRASLDDGVQCGSISNGCGGTVNCDNVLFGCLASETCFSNVCSPRATPSTPTCTPQTRFEACQSARSKQGFDCGSVSDGCGGTLACDVLEGFGCEAGSTCNVGHRCEKTGAPSLPAGSSGAAPTPPAPTTTTAPTDDIPHTTTTPPSAAATTLATGDDDDDAPASDAKDKTKSKKTAASSSDTPSSGCSASATKSGNGPSSTDLSGVALVIAAAVLRRRKQAARPRRSTVS